jgi:hypothetical protein
VREHFVHGLNVLVQPIAAVVVDFKEGHLGPSESVSPLPQQQRRDV